MKGLAIGRDWDGEFPYSVERSGPGLTGQPDAVSANLCSGNSEVLGRVTDSTEEATSSTWLATHMTHLECLDFRGR